MDPYVLGIYGQSNTGKTTIITRILQRLTKEGYRIATIKQTSKKIGYDCKGKDTWRHSNAGASVTVFTSPIETDILIKKKCSLHQIIQQLSMIDSYDCILIEGATCADIPKIRIGTIKKRTNTLWDYQDDFELLVEYIRNKIERKKNEANNASVSVVVNGIPVPLTEFPSIVIRNTITGLIQSLKGVDKIQNITITISN